ncbi:MAG TPA: DNA ligase D [Ignavibacteriaceae bacterium]|nr:DNA ligase D [Ignavibacteriaceae bacterium]
MPNNIKPMLAELNNEVFSNDDWIFEIKWDGYRAVAEIEEGEVNLHSRNNISFNQKYFPIVETLKTFDVNVIFDGEVVIVDDFGKSSFQLLQNFQKSGKGKLVYYIFDILHLDGVNLTNLPLTKRKEILKIVLPADLKNIRFSDHIFGDGENFYKVAEERGLEGILAKRADSKYEIGRRSKNWLKIKTRKRQEAVICGFTQPKGSRDKFGSLILGVFDEGELIYIGQAGTGFTDSTLKEVYAKLKPLITDKSPFKQKIVTNTPPTFVKPKYICNVEFAEWTEEGLMRAPVFLGIREDKNLDDVIKEESPDKNEDEEIISNKGMKDKEIIINGKNLKLTNLNKIYFPDEGYTKGKLIEYYKNVSKYMLPYLKGRPESLNRHPNGINGESFYQKDVKDQPPDWVHIEKIYSEHNEKHINYLVCNNEATLIYLANLGCIEINPWFSRVENLDNPDYLVIDLDPEDISFDKVVEAALAVKEVLDAAGAKSFCKTSGATGLHIYVPLAAKYNYDVAKDFAHLVAQFAHHKVRGFTSLERSPSKRQKKVYLDYLQNRTGQTLAAPYSVRPKPGAPVATPLKWDEVKIGLDPKNYTIKNTLERLAKMGDIFKDVLGKGIDIEKCISKLEAYAKKK